MAADRVERRLAAILAADVAGYSRLMGADEEGTLAAPHRASPRAVRSRRSPNTAAASSRPPATGCSPSSPASSMRCAAPSRCKPAWRSATPASPIDKRIDFRIGINVGDIVEQDGDIFGDGVNIAARLEGIAEPGGICVSARVQEDVAGKIDCRLRGHGRAGAEEHRAAGSRLPRAARRSPTPPPARGPPRRCPTSRRSPCCRSRT